MKNFIFLFSFFFFQQALGEEIKSHQDIKLIARIKSINHKITVFEGKKNTAIPSALNEKKLESEINKLEAGDEALIEGHVIYQATSADGKQVLKPIFLIDAIHPISLKKLGKVDFKIPEQELHITPQEYDDKRKSIRVNNPIVSALTITASLLLLDNLALTNQPTGTEKEINTGLIFSAGVLATGALIYQEVKAKRPQR